MRELLSGYAAANGREQMGRFLRYAFPLDLGYFSEVRNAPKNERRPELPPRQLGTKKSLN
jgi:hypothetical protein